MSTSVLVRRSLCSQTVDGEGGLCKRQKLWVSIDGEVLSSLINDIDDESRTRLKEWFPVLAGSHETNDWSLQLKCFDPNWIGSKRDMEEAFSSSEFVGLCVWLLFTEHSEINKIDVLVLEALQNVKSSFSKDPYMLNDLQPDEVKVIEENLVVDVLCLDSREVQKQVCCALALSVSCNKDRKIAFDDGIQCKLIQLVEKGLTLSCPKDEDSNIICALRTIAYIAAYDTRMVKKIIETEISNLWLAKIMLKTECVSILVEACSILHFVSGKDNETFWMHTVNAFIPGLIRWSHTRDFVLKRAALYAISSITSGASPKQIEQLVKKGGCIKALFNFALGLLDSPDFECFLDGIRNILNAGEDEDDDDDFDFAFVKDQNEIRNKYAKIIDGFEVGWALLSEEEEFCNDDIECKAKGLLKDYAPEYLGKYW